MENIVKLKVLSLFTIFFVCVYRYLPNETSVQCASLSLDEIINKTWR